MFDQLNLHLSLIRSSHSTVNYEDELYSISHSFLPLELFLIMI